MYDNHLVVPCRHRRLDRKWTINFVTNTASPLSATINFNFQLSRIQQKNQYLFLPWLILGFMLCIGLLVDVIYTAVVNFLDDQFTAGVLWLIIGFFTVGECFLHAIVGQLTRIIV